MMLADSQGSDSNCSAQFKELFQNLRSLQQKIRRRSSVGPKYPRMENRTEQYRLEEIEKEGKNWAVTFSDP